MMFDYHEFVFSAIRGMIGSEADYKVRLRAIAHHEQGVLTLDDLEEIEAMLTAAAEGESGNDE